VIRLSIKDSTSHYYQFFTMILMNIVAEGNFYGSAILFNAIAGSGLVFLGAMASCDGDAMAPPFF
jgi:hypothetical protein